MPFHIELHRGVHRARAFNLSAEDLEARFLSAWRDGAEIELGDRRWEPQSAKLAIYEGPELAGPDLAHGQGWSNAQRSGQDVTARVLSAAPPPSSVIVALLADGPASAATGHTLLESIGVAVVGWEPGALQPPPGATRALLVSLESGPSAEWLLTAGAAVATLGARAAVVLDEDTSVPEPLSVLAAARVPAGAPDSPDGRATEASARIRARLLGAG